MSRAPLVVLSALCLIVSAPWWLLSGLAGEYDHSACAGTLSVDLAFGFSHVGALLALGALVAASRPEHHAIGWRLLAGFAALLGISVVILLNCAHLP